MRYFRFLVAGHAASAYGVFLNLIALNLFAYETTGSALQTGLLMALRLFAGVVGGALMGALANRFDLKRVMVTAELAQSVALLSLALFQDVAGTGLLYAVVCVAGLCSTSATVALRTAIPVMVGADQRVWANGLLASCRSVAMVAGFASAGLVVSLLGYTAAFLLVAGTFLLAALNLAWLPLRTRSGEGEESDEPEGAEATEGKDGKGGKDGKSGGRVGRWALLAFLRLYPLVLMLIMVRAVDGFGSSAHNVGLPIQSRELDPANPAVFISQFWVTWAVGNIVAQRLVTRYAKRHGAPSERAFAVGVMVMSAAFILAFTDLPLWLAIPVILLAGMADGFTENTYISRLQALPEKRRGAVFGLCVTVENTSFGIGMIVSAALMEQYTPLTVVGIMHGAALVCALALLVGHRRLAARTPAPAPDRTEEGGDASAVPDPAASPEGDRATEAPERSADGSSPGTAVRTGQSTPPAGSGSTGTDGSGAR